MWGNQRWGRGNESEVVRGGEEVVIVVGSDREREERLSRGEGSTTWIFFVGLGMVGDGMMVVQQKKKGLLVSWW